MDTYTNGGGMTNDEKLIQQALDALVSSTGELHLRLASPTDMQLVNNKKAIEALRVRLAQPEPEPYGRVTVVKREGCVDQHWFYRWPEPPYLDNAAECHTLYIAPPQREWQELTDEEIMSLLPGAVRLPPGWSETVRAIEAKLKEKNNG